MNSIAPDPPQAAPRRATLAGRLSFAAATRLRLRRLPRPPDRGYLSLSFDDIPRSAWTEGGAILDRHGLRGTYYLCGSLCGQVFEGREQFRQGDVADILAQGHEIGSHFYHHHSALALGPRKVAREIALNDVFLSEVAGPGFRARSIAYPYGEVSVGAKWLCSRRFQTARGVRPGVNTHSADRDNLGVLAIDNAFADQTDWDRIFLSVAREKSWAILLAHGLDRSDHPFSCPPARLDQALRAALDAGLTILPVAEVIDRLAADPVA
ncbi:polysaccharide deacetylase family protein [Tabrizicola sp.]|uniref:polysaccharide deacetylase family protein n=1 Tax=Tabrizicola sp. TaxID=2005166 RepID=UPI003F33FFCC